MRFFLVGQHRETGEVSLVSQQTYETRQEALDDLGAAVPPDGSMAGHDLFVIDLDAATPVVVYRAPAAEPVAEEPIADVWEVPSPTNDALAEIVAVEEAALEGPPPFWGFDASGQPLEAEQEPADETPADETPAEDAESAAGEPPAPLWAVAEDPGLDAAPADPAQIADDDAAIAAESDVPPADAGAESLDLAEALRRAATQMESDGVVPAPGVDELAAQAAPTLAGLLPDEPGPETPDEILPESAPAAWPWEADADVIAGDEGEPATAEEPVLQPEAPLPTFTAVGIDEPGLEDIALLTPTSADALSGSRPVIMGEYQDVVDAPVPDDAEPEPASSADAEPELEPETVPEPEFALEPETAPEAAGESGVTSDDGPAEGESAFAEISAAAAAVYEDAGVVAVEAEVKAYEPDGMEIASYSCDDCVYVDTCPKAKQEGPATCGSFQWKSV